MSMSESIVETMARAFDDATRTMTRVHPVDLRRCLRAALKAASDAGWVLAPKEPTGGMNSAGFKHACDHWVGQDVPKMYRAMIAAAPKV